MKHLRNDGFDEVHHLLADIADSLKVNTYFTGASASADAGEHWNKIRSKIPKPMNRPKVKEEPKAPKKFTKTADLLKGGFGKTNRAVIAHTSECVASKVNEGGGQINCSCTVRQR